MPHPEIERLTAGSSEPQIQAAVSACVAAEVRAGKEQDQAVAMCMEMVRGKTGTPAPQGGG